MVPVAPGRLSTTKGWPSFSPMCWAMARAIMSVEPPAGKGTTTVTFFSSHAAAADRAMPAASVMRIFFMDVLLVYFL